MDKTLHVQMKVAELLKLLLGREVAAGEPVHRASEPRWDSIKHLELIFALEDTFEIRLEAAELTGLDSSDAIVAAVERHRAA